MGHMACHDMCHVLQHGERQDLEKELARALGRVYVCDKERGASIRAQLQLHGLLQAALHNVPAVPAPAPVHGPMQWQ